MWKICETCKYNNYEEMCDNCYVYYINDIEYATLYKSINIKSDEKTKR